MKLWMSGEIMADVEEPYRHASNALEACVNTRLEGLTLKTAIREWAFIAIIRPDDHPDYPEIWKKRRDEFEFRLKINHSEFRKSDFRDQRGLIIDALKRSIQKMSELGMAAEDCLKLTKMLDELSKE